MSSRGKRRRAAQVKSMEESAQTRISPELIPFANAHARYMAAGQNQNIVSEALQQAEATVEYFVPDTPEREEVAAQRDELEKLYVAARRRTLRAALEMAQALDDLDENYRAADAD